MRIAFTIAALLAMPISIARADTPTTSFQSGGWQGTAIAQNGEFAFCVMSAVYGKEDSSIVLTMGLDRNDGWMVAVNGDRLSFPTGSIALGVAFDDDPPTDVEGQAKTPTELAFHVQGADMLDRHADAKKLTLQFRRASIPFALVEFRAAVQSLRECLAANTKLAAIPPAPPPVLPAAAPAPRRFGTLAAAKVDVRAKPALDSPADWILRSGLPVEIIETRTDWKKIRASDGTEGWVRGTMISDTRDILVVSAVLTLRQSPQVDAAIVARLEPGVIAQVLQCDGAWCELAAGDYRGWAGQAPLWAWQRVKSFNRRPSWPRSSKLRPCKSGLLCGKLQLCSNA